MKGLPKPNNEYALVVWLLIQNKYKGVTMKDACAVLFYKFQSRLGELERSPNQKGRERRSQLKILRLRMTKKNRFGHTMSFLNYKSVAALPYLVNLYKRLNKNGLKKTQK